MSACSDNQSTILPFPSSPHSPPTTTTLALPISIPPSDQARAPPARPPRKPALAQHVWLDDPRAQPLILFGMCMITAAVSGGLIWIEMQARSRRHHSGLADAMVSQAIEQFLPVGAAGALFA